MKSFVTLQAVILFTFFVYDTALSQTKQERTAPTKGRYAGMYNSSEDKEALEYFEQGHVAATKKDYKDAIKFYKKAIEEDPKFVEAHDNLAAAYRKLGDFDNAISYYKKSLELYPDGSMAHTNLGVIYTIQKKYGLAIEEYETLQKLEPDNAEGFYGVIQIYLTQGKYEKAIENAKKALEIYEATEDPYLPDGQYLLGMSYYYNKDLANAKIYIEQAKKNGVQIPPDLLKELKIK